MIALSVLVAFTFFVREGVQRSFRFYPYFHFHGKIRYSTIYNRIFF